MTAKKPQADRPDSEHAAPASPEAVVSDPRLTRDQKIEQLRRWEYDAVAQSVAQEEGMVASRDGDWLRRILDALRKLTDGQDVPRQGPPTKYSG